MGPIPFKVEETLVNGPTFAFNGQAVASMHELPPVAGSTWPADLTNDRLIQVEQGVHFHFAWGVSGAVVPLLSSNLVWKIQLFFEKWGQSESPLNPSTTVRYVPTSGFRYNALINIPGNTLSEGVYDVVAVIRLYNVVSGVTSPLPVAGFVEMGKFEFFEQS